MFLTGMKKLKSTKTWFLDILECIGCVHGKNTLRDSRGELLSINANIGIYWPTRVRCFWPERKSSKITKTWFLDILEYIGCVHNKNSPRDSRGKLLSINANIGTRGCDVFDRNQKVQKWPKHDFWTYWSILGAFIAKIYFVIRAANFCQLMPLLAHVAAMLLTGMKKFKKHENMIFGRIWVYWVRSWQKLTSWFVRRTFVN